MQTPDGAASRIVRLCSDGVRTATQYLRLGLGLAAAAIASFMVRSTGAGRVCIGRAVDRMDRTGAFSYSKTQRPQKRMDGAEAAEKTGEGPKRRVFECAQHNADEEKLCKFRESVEQIRLRCGRCHPRFPVCLVRVRRRTRLTTQRCTERVDEFLRQFEQRVVDLEQRVQPIEGMIHSLTNTHESGPKMTHLSRLM